MTRRQKERRILTPALRACPCCIMLLVALAAPANGQPTAVVHPIQGTSLDVDVYGNMFVLDARKGTVTLYDKSFRLVSETGGPGWENGQFDEPAGLWARNGLDVFVADQGNHRVQRFDRTLSFVSVLFTRDSDNPAERFGYPSDVALSRLGELYICDTENARIVKVNAQNKVERSFGDFGGGRGRLMHPTRLGVGPGDAVVVLDTPRVVIFDGFGNFITTLPEAVVTSPSCLFADPEMVAVVDGGRIVCFDQAFRPSSVVALRDLAGDAPANIRSIAFAGGKCYLLTDAAVLICNDPRQESTRLDKEEKTH